MILGYEAITEVIVIRDGIRIKNEGQHNYNKRIKFYNPLLHILKIQFVSKRQATKAIDSINPTTIDTSQPKINNQGGLVQLQRHFPFLP